MAEVSAADWQRAALVLVAGEAVQQVGELLSSDELPSRPNVFAISTGDHVAAATWNGDIDHILHCPSAPTGCPTTWPPSRGRGLSSAQWAAS